MSSPSLAQLKRAITISEKIEALQAEMAGILGTSRDVVGNGKRKYTRRATAEAGEEEAAPEKKPRKKRKPLSDEARAKIVEAQKKRWAKIKKEKKAKAKVEAAAE